MTSKNCRNCRFFDGSACAVRKARCTPGSTCNNFISSTGGSNDEHCRACRFFDGQICSVWNKKVTPGNSCNNWAVFRA